MDNSHPFHPIDLARVSAMRIHHAPLPYTIEPLGVIRELPDDSTHVVMVVDGECRLRRGDRVHPLGAGMFGVVPGSATIDGDPVGLVISIPGYVGLFQIGGPLESVGRLTYIDGCTDTLLVCPPRLGEPCLNHLHIPPGTSQTRHTHPTDRVGVILRGSGICRTPDGEWELSAGMGWRIPAGCLHSFFTAEDSLDVIAWHPDSDFGPTDENHPMRNKTIVGGASP